MQDHWGAVELKHVRLRPSGRKQGRIEAEPFGFAGTIWHALLAINFLIAALGLILEAPRAAAVERAKD